MKFLIFEYPRKLIGYVEAESFHDAVIKLKGTPANNSQMYYEGGYGHRLTITPLDKLREFTSPEELIEFMDIRRSDSYDH